MQRQFQQRWTPSLVVVGILLVAAAITSAVLWMALNDNGSAARPDAPLDPGASVGAIDDEGLGTNGLASDDPVPPESAGPVSIVGWQSYDPNGNGTENDDLLGNLVDADPATAWTTMCYSNQFLGATQGVGVVAELSRASTGQVEVDVASGPWQVQLFAADELPTQLDGWGPYVASDFGQEPRTARFDLVEPARFVLVWMTELGRATRCSSENPYQGALTRVLVSPTG